MLTYFLDPLQTILVIFFIEIQTLWFDKKYLKMLAKWWPFCSGLKSQWVNCQTTIYEFKWYLCQNTNNLIEENAYNWFRPGDIWPKYESVNCIITNWFKYWLVACLAPGQHLTHWSRVTHLCVSKLTSIASDNGLSPGRRQAIIWNNAGILLIGPLGTNISEILIEINAFSFKKMHLKTSSAKRRPFCLGLNVFNILRLKVKQKGWHFPDDIFKWIFLNENIWIWLNISLKFVPKDPINNIPALVQKMALTRRQAIIWTNDG